MENINKDTIKGSLVELKGKAMQYWSKLTENDFSEFKGNIEELKGKVQKIYGYGKEELEKEFEAFKAKGMSAANRGVESVNDSIDHKTDKLN